MKRNRFIAVFLIFVSLFAISCNITHNAEGTVEAVVATPVRILRGVQGKDFGIPASTSTPKTYDNQGYHFTINLTKGSFDAFTKGASAPITVEPQIDGLTYTVYNNIAKGDTSMIVEVSGTVSDNVAPGEYPITIKMSGSAFSPTHYSDVKVRTTDAFKFDILDKNEPYAILYPSDTSRSSASGPTNREYYYMPYYESTSSVGVVSRVYYRQSFATIRRTVSIGSDTRADIQIINDNFDTTIVKGGFATSWLNAPTEELSLYIPGGFYTSTSTTQTVRLTYNPSDHPSSYTFYNDNIVIPKENTKSRKDVKVINLYYYPISIYDYVATAFIESSDQSATTASPFSTRVTINLNGGKVYTKLNKGQDMSSFIASGAVPGLSYNAVGSEVNDTKIQMDITGTPLQSGSFELQFKIPGNQGYKVDLPGLPYGESNQGRFADDVPVSGTLTINVEAGDFYDYKLYDLASFGTSEATLSVLNENAGLTTDLNGNPLEFEAPSDRRILKSGVVYQKLPPTVTYEPGLKRRGYILKGFSRRLAGDSSVDVSRVDYPISDPTKPISFTLNNSEKGNTISLYAVWELDPDAWGWTKNADGSYNKTTDTSEGGKYLPATFDVNKAYPDTTDDTGAKVDNSALRANYIDYPYYREAKVLAKDLRVPGVNTIIGTYYNDLDDVQLKTDFAIGEQVITGYMLDVLREWNTTGNKGYDIPTEFADTTSKPTGTPSAGTNQVGYGARYESSDYKVNNEKSEPITFVTVSQSIVIANAMSAYYNDKKGLNTGSDGYLDSAYVSTDGTEIKTLSDADKIVSALTASDAGKALAKEGAKGFRLPTAEEWGLAARIVPESLYPTVLTGAHISETAVSIRNYMYPQLTRSNMWSGDTAIANGVAQNTLADKYVWYAYNSSVVGENLGASHGFLKNVIKTKVSYPGTVLDKLPNNIGVYGMSGNVWEWCDQFVVSGSNLYIRLRGGSFSIYASGTRVGSLGNTSASARYGDCGLRLARGL